MIALNFAPKCSRCGRAHVVLDGRCPDCATLFLLSLDLLTTATTRNGFRHTALVPDAEGWVATVTGDRETHVAADADYSRAVEKVMTMAGCAL